MLAENELIPYEEESLNSQVPPAEIEETTRLLGEVTQSITLSILRQYWTYVKKIKEAIQRVSVEEDYTINQTGYEFQEEEEEEKTTNYSESSFSLK
jgi:hypothetical protein